MADKDEPAWWAGIEVQAVAAFDFWHSFLDLQRGPNNNDPLTPTDVAAFRRILRAVSWVESKHGHGGGSSAVDPLQCGNPADSWWKTLTGQSGNGDRFIRGPNQSPNYYAKALPSAAATESSFPNAAKLTSLSEPKDGHSDAKYGSLMSFYWGTPYLIHRTNTGAGAKTYQCGDCTEQRLIDGAVAYNGGGDPNYRKKIEAALKLIDQPVLFSVEALSTQVAEPANVLAALLGALAKATGGDLMLFPNGITSLKFELDLTSMRLKLDVKGPSQSRDSVGKEG